jgi:P-type Cu+ transporter
MEHSHCSTCVKKSDIVRLWGAIICGLPLVGQMFLPIHLPLWLQAVLATLVQFGAGWGFLIGAFRSVRSGRADMDLLIFLGTSVAYFDGLVIWLSKSDQPIYFETSAIIITFVLFGQFLETRSRGRASAAIEELLRLQPQTARVRREGQWVEVAVHALQVGDLFQIRPGESVAVDGEVVEGGSSINEAMLTGESMPVEKAVGAQIYTGTQNGKGTLVARATAVGEQSSLARIVRLVHKAQMSRAPVQRLADRVSSIFVPIVLLIALATFLIWFFVFGNLELGIVNATAVLIIACPCALGLATPTVIVVATSVAAKQGILVRDAAALQRARRLDLLLFDKTGTITQGRPEVTDFWEGQESISSIARSLEEKSEHPLGEAIARWAAERGGELLHVEQFEAVAGRGVRGEIGGKKYWLGSASYAAEAGISHDWVSDQTVALLWDSERCIGAMAISDPVRANAVQAIEGVKRLGIEPVLVTGDRRRTALSVAAQVGIEEVRAELLPEQKVEVIGGFQRDGQQVGMVGDGINDAPALAAADVGFAIGAGAGAAVEAADITLMRSDPRSAVVAIQLAQATHRKIKQNLLFAFIYNSLSVPLAAIGLISPIIAGAAMALSSLSVVSNALLLKRWKSTF